jgi:hypothetical protein
MSEDNWVVQRGRSRKGWFKWKEPEYWCDLGDYISPADPYNFGSNDYLSFETEKEAEEEIRKRIELDQKEELKQLELRRWKEKNPIRKVPPYKYN